MSQPSGSVAAMSPVPGVLARTRRPGRSLCQSCRRHSGAPVSVFVGFEVNAYTVTKGEISKFKSSPETTRGLCRTCGSTLTCETAQLPTETHFHVGTFDEPGKFEPSKHFFRNEQLPWLHLK